MPRLIVTAAKDYQLVCEGRHEIAKAYEYYEGAHRVVRYGEKFISDLWIVEGLSSTSHRFMTTSRDDAMWLFEKLTDTVLTDREKETV